MYQTLLVRMAALIVMVAACATFVGCPGGPVVSVPNVTSMSRTSAEATIAAAGLSVGQVTQTSSNSVPAGHVIMQSPQGGVLIEAGSPVDLTVSFGTGGSHLVNVPSVVNLSRNAAESAIEAAGLSVGRTSRACHATIPAGYVVSQNPAAGQAVEEGSEVDLVVSRGPEEPEFCRLTVTVSGNGDVVQYPSPGPNGYAVGTEVTLTAMPGDANTVFSHWSGGLTGTANPRSFVLEHDMTVSAHFTLDTVTVPNVVDMTQEAAEDAIEAERLTVGTVSTEHDDNVGEGRVIRQSPAGGVTAQCGDSVNLVVSLGPDQTAWYEDYDFEAVGCVAYWPFDTDTKDYSGNGLDAVGGAPAAGQIGGAYRVDNTYMEVAPSPLLDNFNEMTISCWFSPENTHPIGSEFIMGRGKDDFWGTQDWYGLVRGGGDEFFGAFQRNANGVNGGGTSTSSTFRGVQLNRWYHLTAVFSDGRSAFYVHDRNGNLLACEQHDSGVSWTLDVPNAEPLYFGRHNFTQGWSSRIIGRFDEAVIFDRALSSDEVTALATDQDVNGIADFWEGSYGDPWYEWYDFEAVGCVAYWPFDTDTKDYSGNGLDAVGGAPAVGQTGGAYRVDNTYMEVAPSPILDNFNEMTISCWFSPENTHPIGSEFIMGRGKDDFWGTQDWYGLVRGGGDEFFGAFQRNANGVNGGGTSTSSTFRGVQLNRWYHLTAVFSDGRSAFYVHDRNGNLLACEQHDSGVSWTLDVPNAEPLYFGRHNFTQGWSSRIIGRFDEAVIFDRALSSGEIHALANDENVDGIADFWQVAW